MLLRNTISLGSFASKVIGILHKSASFEDGPTEIAAAQRNGFDITKCNNAPALGGLGNVVRGPSIEGSGVSQAPAITEPGTGEAMASEQFQAALQGGIASPLGKAANAASDDAAWHARKLLIETVANVRQALASYGEQQTQTTKKYQRIARGLRMEVRSLLKSLPRQTTQSPDEYGIYVLKVVLGSHATSSSTFYSYRRSLQYWAEAELRRLLKKQNRLQKRHQKRNTAHRAHLLPDLMQRSAKQLDLFFSYFQALGQLKKQECLNICHKVGKEVKQVKLLHTKELVRLLNRCKPDWQSMFLTANAASCSQYRSHALLQVITGVRPAEFDPSKGISNSHALKGDVSPGVVVTMLPNQRIRIRIPGAKVTKHAGHIERIFEVPCDELPSWFLDELSTAGGSKRYVAKSQALRDHYERVSVQAFGKKPADLKKPWLHATPYCFRHALATNLRWSGWDVEEIAGVLGQRSADTQKHYGFRKGGKKKPITYIEPSIARNTIQTTQRIKPQTSQWASNTYVTPLNHSSKNRYA